MKNAQQTTSKSHFKVVVFHDPLPEVGPEEQHVQQMNISRPHIIFSIVSDTNTPQDQLTA
jgi:hypothetical protein